MRKASALANLKALMHIAGPRIEAFPVRRERA
jgi:hypothetical protein